MRPIKDVQKKVKTYMQDVTLNPKEFVHIEILFRLCERIGIKKEVNKFYMLLSKADVIYDKHFGPDNYLISNAKSLLTTLSHSKVYKDTLEEYRLKGNNPYCLYVVEDNCLKRNPNVPVVYADRVEDYDALLDEGEIRVARPKEKTNIKDKYTVRLSSELEPIIQFEKMNVKKNMPSSRIRIVEPLAVSINDVLKSARRLDDFEGTEYRIRTLQDNIYLIKNGKKESISEFVIEDVVNMAGQVAAGKSTFADALSITLADKKKRVVLIQPTVDLVLKKAELLEKLGYSVCPLIGNYGRRNHINNQMRGSSCLPQYQSKILQQPCMLNALLDEPDFVINYGQEPCVSLKKKGEKNPRKNYICQYYNFCPRTQMDRNISQADIIVTTLEGFCYCKFGADKQSFLVYAINEMDLVIMDEVDSVVCTLDEIFAPSLAVNDYLKNSLEYRNEFQRGDLNDKLQWETDGQEFIHKLTDFEHLMCDISGKVKEKLTGWSDSDLRNFSAMILLRKLEPDKARVNNELSEDIWNALYDLLKPLESDPQIELITAIQRGDIQLSYVIKKLVAIICEDTNKSRQLVTERCENISTRTWKKLLFILSVIAFEHLYRDLSRLIDGLNDVPIELREILNRNLMVQQKLMPSAPLGNTLAIEVKENEMYIKKQFALGRALALRMPYLKLDAEGSPIGAKVLLMSGTGYIPGCNRYHVSNRVDYIIEAEQSKRDYIAKTKTKNLKGSICVSGAAREKKNNNLQALIEEVERTILKCIKKEERILMIVNSYEQCKVAYKKVEQILNRNQSIYQACYLKSDSEGFVEESLENGIQRRDITKFDKGILIAPACVIERGYNIVDYLGNAWFDTVMFLVRPMTDPNDYKTHVQSVNGYIMNNYSDLKYKNRIEVVYQMRKDAFERYAKLDHTKGSLSDLPEDLQRDVVATLFVVIEQVFGRLCRLGRETKDKYPTIYWVDGAFNRTEKGSFDTLKELEQYLEFLMNKSNDPIVAKTLYEPFYKALRGEKR